MAHARTSRRLKRPPTCWVLKILRMHPTVKEKFTKLKRHQFSGLIYLAVELLHTP